MFINEAIISAYLHDLDELESFNEEGKREEEEGRGLLYIPPMPDYDESEYDEEGYLKLPF